MSLDKLTLDDDDYRIMLVALMTFVKAADQAAHGSALARARRHAHVALMKLQKTTQGFSINNITGDDYNAIVRALSAFSEGLSISPLRKESEEHAQLVDEYLVKASNAGKKLRAIAEAHGY